jgi:hypothetical protein
MINDPVCYPFKLDFKLQVVRSQSHPLLSIIGPAIIRQNLKLFTTMPAAKVISEELWITKMRSENVIHAGPTTSSD